MIDTILKAMGLDNDSKQRRDLDVSPPLHKYEKFIAGNCFIMLIFSGEIEVRVVCTLTV